MPIQPICLGDRCNVDTIAHHVTNVTQSLKYIRAVFGAIIATIVLLPFITLPLIQIIYYPTLVTLALLSSTVTHMSVTAMLHNYCHTVTTIPSHYCFPVTVMVCSRNTLYNETN